MADQTPDALELNCPGCGAYFRLKPKKGKLPEGPIPCPKCKTPIPVAVVQPVDKDTAEVPSLPAAATSKGVSGEGASRDRMVRRPNDDDSLPGFGGPMNPLAAMLQDDGTGPNSTFLGFQKLPFYSPEGSTRVLNPDEMVPEAELPEDPQQKKGSTTDTSRFLREEMAAERGDLPMAPHLRNTRENLAVQVEPLPDLFDDDDDDSLGEMLSQARLGPEGDSVGDATRMEEVEAGPFDLRDILEAEKHRVGETNAHEVTRNPLLEKGYMPEPEAEKPKENPWARTSSQTLDDLMGEVDTNKRQSGLVRAVKPTSEPANKPADEAPAPADAAPPAQLAKLKLGLRRAKEAEVRETSERSSSAAFGRSALSSGDIFSESSSVAQDDASAAPLKLGAKPAPAALEPAPEPEVVNNPKNKRTLPLTPVMPAPAVLPSAALPEEEQAGASPDHGLRSSPSGQQLTPFADGLPAAASPDHGLRSSPSGAPLASRERGREFDASAASDERKAPNEPIVQLAEPLPAAASPDHGLRSSPSGQRLTPFADGLPAAASLDHGHPAKPAAAQAPKADEAPSAPAGEEKKEKAPPLAALLKRKINTDKLKALGEGAGLGESSSAASEDATRVAPAGLPEVERPADDSPGFETSIAEVLKRAEEQLGKAPTPEPAASAVKEEIKPAPTPEVGDKPSKPSLSLPAADPLRTSGVLGALKRRSQSVTALQPEAGREPAGELEAGRVPGSSSDELRAVQPGAKDTAPHRPLPSLTTGEQPALKLPASLAGLPNLSSAAAPDKRAQRARQSTEPMFPVAPSGLLSIQPPSSQQGNGGPMGGGLSEPSQVGMAGEKRGSGYIRLPTSEILEVLGQGSYRILVEDIVYEPVDEQGLTELIKRGVLLGAEQIAEADGDWMPIGEHPVFRRLRRRMAMEAHALLAKYRKASEERIKREQAGKSSDDELLDLLVDDADSGEPVSQELPAIKAPAEPSESDEELDLWGGAKVMEISEPARPALALDAGDEAAQEPLPLPALVAPADTASIEFPAHIDSSGGMAVAQTPEPAPAPAPELEEEPQDVAPIEPEPEEEPQAEPVSAPVEPAQPVKTPEVAARPVKPRVEEPEEEPVKPGRSGTLVLALVGLLIVGAVAAVLLVPGLRESLLGGGAVEPTPAVKPDEPVAKPDEPVKQPDPVEEPVKEPAADQGVAQADQGTAPVEEPVKEPVGAGGELAAQWAKAPADAALALRLVEAQRGAGELGLARRTALLSLAAGATPREGLEAQYLELLGADDMKVAEARRIKVGEDADSAVAQRLYGRIVVELRRGDKPVAMFFPDVLDEPGNWRAQVAAKRLCLALGCPMALPELEPVFVVDKDLKALKQAAKDVKQADTDELDWNGEKVEGVEGRPDVLRGVMVAWGEGQAAWPTEAANVWRPWLDPATDMAELGAPLKEALGGLERYQGGVWFEPARAQAGEASVASFARAVSGLLLLDYLVGNWERYARPDQGINALVRGGELVALYQGTAFPSRTSSRVKGRFDYFGRYDAAMAEGLGLISPERLDEVLFPGASGAERAGLRVFWERRDDALKRIEAQVKRHGAEKVLFTAP